MLKIKIISFFLITCLLVFLIREFLYQKNTKMSIYGEKKIIYIKTAKGQIIEFGDKQSQNGQVLKKAITSYLSNQDDILVIQNQPSNKELKLKTKTDFIIKKLSPNFSIVQLDQNRIFLIGKKNNEEEKNFKLQPVNFQSDFWVLKTNYIPNFLPSPNIAILYINDRQPSKKIKQFAYEQQVPLISVYKTNGFYLSKDINSSWQLKTRQ